MEALLELMRNCGAAAAGAVPIPALAAQMPEVLRRRAQAELPGAAWLLVGVFPYFTDFLPGDIALYARGMDYHGVLQARLGRVARQAEAERPGLGCRVYVDASPYPEVWAAALCGLGEIGQNGLLITPRHGSLVFIGTVAITAHVYGGPQSPGPAGGDRGPRFCQGCGRCVRMCPTGALGSDGLDKALCLSEITQLRGGLTGRQAEWVAQGGMVWGCDVCQKVCPMNRDMPVTAIPEFAQDLLRAFPRADAGLSQRAFKEKYGNRAFAWRGVGPLRRNVGILEQSTRR